MFWASLNCFKVFIELMPKSWLFFMLKVCILSIEFDSTLDSRILRDVFSKFMLRDFVKRTINRIFSTTFTVLVNWNYRWLFDTRKNINHRFDRYLLAELLLEPRRLLLFSRCTFKVVFCLFISIILWSLELV